MTVYKVEGGNTYYSVGVSRYSDPVLWHCARTRIDVNASCLIRDFTREYGSAFIMRTLIEQTQLVGHRGTCSLRFWDQPFTYSVHLLGHDVFKGYIRQESVVKTHNTGDDADLWLVKQHC